MTKTFIISRVDSLGDVVLTLPVAGVLKEIYPDSRIIFLGNNYTAALIHASSHIDQFVAWDELKRLPPAEQVNAFKSLKADVIIHIFPRPEIAKLASRAKIPKRMGTNRRWYHWLYCNQRVMLARRETDFHESQLNLQLLTPLGASNKYDLSQIPYYYGLNHIAPLSGELRELISEKRYNLILHPKSKGSAREWGLENFSGLIRVLPKERYKIFITGTQNDGDLIKDFLTDHQDDIVNLTGKFDLKELISFIHAADGIVAASTGPLHIASALGRYALGLYAPMRPIHPGRWAPVGDNAAFLVLDKTCNACRKSTECQCLKNISPEDVLQKLDGQRHKEGPH